MNKLTIEEIEFDRIKFLNVGYRELFGIYQNKFIISIYPFVTKCYLIPQSFKFKFKEWKHSWKEDIKQLMVFEYHHQDYCNKEIKIDPCDIFENTYGIKIHSGESDKHKMNCDNLYKDSKYKFESIVLELNRCHKIEEIIGKIDHTLIEKSNKY